MMKQKLMNRFHKRNSSTSSSLDFKSGEKLDFKFSSLQALQVPTGWDKLTVSLISIDSDKTVTKSGKASVYNGNCRWTETLSESIWISQDDLSKGLQQCLYKLQISKASTRSGILGEVTVNLSNYLSLETSLPVALPLKKCDHGTILQVAIQCLNPPANLRWKDTNYIAEDVNSEYSDLDNMSDIPHGKNINNKAGSSSTNSVDTSQVRGLHSRETSVSTVRSYHSFDSMDDSFGRESSVSNVSEVAIDLNGKPESTGLVNVYDSPRSNRSGKNLLSHRQDSGKVSHIPASPLRNYNSSEFVLEAEGSTPEELRAEARSWERNARKLKVDLDLSRNETINQTKNLENVSMELSALQKECKGLKDEIKHLKILLGESAGKERDTDSLKIQVQDKKDIQAKLEEEIKFQKNLNDDLGLQLDKTQESNLELVSILQELEETIEKQRLEMKSLESSEQPESDSRELDVELQKFQESQKRLENTIFHLEKSLEDKSQTLQHKESEWRQELSVKDEEINTLKAKLSEAFVVPVAVPNPIKTHDLDEEVEALKEKVLELERDCNELTDENLDLLYKLKDSNMDLPTDGADLKFTAQLSNLKIVNNRLEESLKVMEKELDDTKDSHIAENKILEKKLSELEAHNHELNLQLAELEEENLDLSGRVFGLESQLKILTDDRESSRLEAEHSESRILKLQAEIKEMENKLDSTKVDMKQKVQDMQNKCLEAQEECEYLKNANPKHQAELRESQDNYLKLLKISEDLEEKISSLIDGVESKEKMFDSEINDLHLKFKDYTEKCVNGENMLNQMYTDKVVEAENLKQEVEHLKLQISSTHDERDIMASEAVLEMHVLRADKDKMINSIAEVEEKLRSSEKKISDLTLEIAASKQNNEKLTELLENTRSSEEKLENTVSEFSADIKSCEDKIVQITEENSSLKVQLQRIPVLQDEIATLQNSLNDIKYENERLSASLQMASDDNQQLKEENTSLHQKTDSMQKLVIELEDHKRNKIDLEEKLLKLQGDLTAREALSAQDAEWKNEVRRLKRSNNQFQLEVSRLQEENDEYIKKMQVFEELKQDLKPNEHEDKKLTEDLDSRIQSLETALAEALEANEMYKLQLKSFMSEGKDREPDRKLEVQNEEINKEHKNHVSSLERELGELQERYLHMSLKYAEVEAEREELVLKLKGTAPGRSWFS